VVLQHDRSASSHVVGHAGACRPLDGHVVLHDDAVVEDGDARRLEEVAVIVDAWGPKDDVIGLPGIGRAELPRPCSVRPGMSGLRNSTCSWKSPNWRLVIASPPETSTEPSSWTFHSLALPSRFCHPSQDLPSKSTTVLSSSCGGLAPIVGDTPGSPAGVV
jgi:hypothetical protein